MKILPLITLVISYGYNIHSHLGKLSDIYLEKYEPKLYNQVKHMLNGETIEKISSWADTIKNKPNYKWTKQLHYIDILECKKTYSKQDIHKYCNNNCIVSALQDFTNSIKYNFNHTNSITHLTNTQLLKLLIHLIQDFSQPMHLLGFERGGNSLKINIYINNKNKTTNLHYIWDSMLPEYFIKHYNYQFTPKNYNSIHNYDDYYNLLQNILNTNIINVSCLIYPKSHYIIFDNYFNKNYFVTLFNNYQLLIINTLKYIFEPSLI
jgi:hypothetical protein